jgi:hypothetical protein
MSPFLRSGIAFFRKRRHGVAFPVGWQPIDLGMPAPTAMFNEQFAFSFELLQGALHLSPGEPGVLRNGRLPSTAVNDLQPTKGILP